MREIFLCFDKKFVAENSNPIVIRLVSYVKFLRQKYFKIYFNYVKQL